jgi:hypothetical protein
MLRLQKVTNGAFEEESALINIDTKEVVVKGDYYHDKIDEYIDGVLYGLSYSGIDYEILDTIVATPNTELFKLCDFYDDGSYEDEKYEDKIDQEDDADYENDSIDNIEEVKEEENLLPYQVEHQFEVCGTERTRKIYCNIIEALDMVRDCEGDLFCDDIGIVYSCLGLEDDDNNELLEPFGVYYDEDNELQHVIGMR